MPIEISLTEHVGATLIGVRGIHHTLDALAYTSNGEVRTATSTIRRLKFNVPRLPRPVSSDSQEKYTTIWTMRGIMLLRMVQVGMKSLPVGNITLTQFADMNPDQKGHLKRLILNTRGTHSEVSSVKQLVKLCGNPRPELLSMMCCFAGDRCWDSIDLDTIDVQAWARERERLRRLHGMQPHVAEVCKKMRRS